MVVVGLVVTVVVFIIRSCPGHHICSSAFVAVVVAIVIIVVVVVVLLLVIIAVAVVVIFYTEYQLLMPTSYVQPSTPVPTSATKRTSTHFICSLHLGHRSEKDARSTDV